MDTKSLSAQVYDFSGSIPRHYDKILGPMFFEPYATEVCKRIDPVPIHLALELAAGTGRVTRHLRQLIPSSSKLVASDISEDMLSVAKEKLKETDIHWQIIDAQELPFDDNSVDLIVCCFGYMFVPDKPKAFKEAFRVLKPGGMLLMATWDSLEKNGASYIYRTSARKYLPDPLPESFHLPFLMSDETIIQSYLQNAGFSNIVIEKVQKDCICSSSKEAISGLAQGGLIYEEIMKRNPVWLEEIKESAEKELAEKYGSSPMIAPMSAFISSAIKK